MRTEEELRQEFNRINLLEQFSAKLATELRIIHAEFEPYYGENYPNARKAIANMQHQENLVDNSADAAVISKFYETLQLNMTLARKDNGFFAKVKYAQALLTLYNASYSQFQKLAHQQKQQELLSKNAIDTLVTQQQRKVAELEQRLNETQAKLNETQVELDKTLHELEQSRLNTSLNVSMNTSEINLNNSVNHYRTKSFINVVNKNAEDKARVEDKQKLYKHALNGNREKYHLVLALQKLVISDNGDATELLNQLIFELMADPNNDVKYTQIRSTLVNQGVSNDALKDCFAISQQSSEASRPSSNQLKAAGQLYKSGLLLTKNEQYVQYFVKEYKAQKNVDAQQTKPSFNN